MVILRIRRWLLGLVSFEAECAAPERLLDGCARAGLPLWNVRRRGLVLRGQCSLATYRRLRVRRIRGDVRPRVTARHGLPFHLRRLRRRGGLAVGAVLASVLLWWLGGRVWVIDVQGNKAVPTAAILQAAAAEGVHIGMPVNALDIRRLQLTLPGHEAGLSWATVNPDGCVAHIVVTERGQTPDILTEGAYSDLCAAVDGVIVEVRAQTGQAAVRPGEAVAAGDVLVRGTVETARGPLYYRSVGQVLARVQRTLTVRIPLCETLLLPTGRQICRPSLYLFGASVPLYSDRLPEEPYTAVQERYFLRGGRYELPVGLQAERLTLLEAVTVTRTPAQAYTCALEQLQAMEAEAFAGATVEKREASQVQKEGYLEVSVRYTAVTDIAQEVIFSASQNCE